MGPRIGRQIALAITLYSFAACNEERPAAPIGATCPMTATLVRVTPDSDAGCIHTLIELDDRSNCFVFEVMRDASATTCEDVASGLCTPGAAPCRAGPVDLATAASSLIVAVAVGSAIERMSATVEGANVIVVGSDGTKHLVCESLPLARGTPESEACLNDPKLDVTVAASGWCYSQTPVVTCSSGFRFTGDARPREGSQIAVACGC